MSLQWIPGKPSGPTKQIYYSTAKHAGGDFTVCVASVAGEKFYQLWRDQPKGKALIVMARASRAACINKAEELAHEV